MTVATNSTIDAQDTDQQECFHCGLPVPVAGQHYKVVINGAAQPMCCPGCKAVAEGIVNAGLTDYYRYRTATSRTAQELVPDVLRQLDVYDNPTIQKTFVSVDAENIREAALILEGMVCAACVWLNERHVGRLPGVKEFTVNYTTQRARVKWDDSQIHLSDILRAITAIGYVAHPFDSGRQEAVYKRERNLALRRVAVAGLGMMQVMMLSVALYAGEYSGIDADMEEFLRWVSFVISVPVLLYSSQPFFLSAWRDLKHYQLGMDVPVALGIGGAFAASFWHTVIGQGEIYFDSVVMFSFFLLTGRYLEMIARHRAGQAAEALVKLLPATATRITESGDEIVAVAELVPGERVRIKPGEAVPADGTVLDGISSVDESLLTGESLPISRHAGEELIGGTVNIESPLIMRVDKVGTDTVLSAIVRLLDRAQSEKPQLAQLADRIAGWFVGVLLLLAALIAWYWLQTDPTRAFPIVLSVLVVTCPCALALATPVALTAATGALTRMGVLTTRSHALETLARVTHVVFDKTGTLTEGRLTQTQVVRLGLLTRDRCVAIAAALEQGSEHPLGRALIAAANVTTPLPVSQQRAVAGEGMEGAVQGVTYRIGTLEFAQALSGRSCELPEILSDTVGTVVYLADARGVLAGFVFEDTLRAGAAEAVAELRALGIQVQLLSGDAEAPVREIAARLGITSAEARLKPADKLQRLQALQAQGAIVAMIGDGVNDAPVLAAAQVSLAMGSGTQLAAAAADMVLLSERLGHLAPAVLMARRTLVVIRQNLAWSLIYNLLAVPLAAAGMITPWMASIGMSASSLLVVVNALRLREAPEMGIALKQTR